MGTTQKIVPGVPGQPNWRDLNNSITHIAKTVEQDKEEDNSSGKSPEQVASEHQKIEDRRQRHIRQAYRRLIKTGGGKREVKSGQSASFGRAGIVTAGKLVRFFTDVKKDGLAPTLRKNGLENAKSLQAIVDFLIVYASDSAAGMDETAANKAACEVLSELAESAGNDIDAFESILKEYVSGEGLTELLCKYWGHYIFEHLSQRFQEKVAQDRGEDISKETFNTIKEDIPGRMDVINQSQPVRDIDWKGTEGQKHINTIFQSIIDILYGTDDDN